MSACAGKDCFWMDYQISDAKAERYDANYASGSVAMPPKFRKRREGEREIIEPNYDYNLYPFPALRAQFEKDALPAGSKKYVDSSNGCTDNCSCSILDNPDPKDVKISTFRVPFKTTLTENFDDGSSLTYTITGTYKVTAVKRPGMCVDGEYSKTPDQVIKYDAREVSEEESSAWQTETDKKDKC